MKLLCNLNGYTVCAYIYDPSIQALTPTLSTLIFKLELRSERE